MPANRPKMAGSFGNFVEAAMKAVTDPTSKYTFNPAARTASLKPKK